MSSAIKQPRVKTNFGLNNVIARTCVLYNSIHEHKDMESMSQYWLYLWYSKISYLFFLWWSFVHDRKSNIGRVDIHRDKIFHLIVQLIQILLALLVWRLSINATKCEAIRFLSKWNPPPTNVLVGVIEGKIARYYTPRLMFRKHFNEVISKFLRAGAALSVLLCWKISLSLNIKLLLFT